MNKLEFDPECVEIDPNDELAPYMKARWSKQQLREVITDGCSLNNPLHLYVPPGKTVTIPCKVHGEHIIEGNKQCYVGSPRLIKHW
jgi:hypothetical protein